MRVKQKPEPKPLPIPILAELILKIIKTGAFV